MKKILSAFALLVFAVVTLGASCGTGTQEALLSSGATLKAVGSQWRAVNARFVEGCKPSGPTLDKKMCDAARAFGEKFQKGYPLAVDLYEVAVNAQDTAMAGDARATIRRLSAELVSFGLKVGIEIQGVK